MKFILIPSFSQNIVSLLSQTDLLLSVNELLWRLILMLQLAEKVALPENNLHGKKHDGNQYHTYACQCNHCTKRNQTVTHNPCNFKQ